MKKTFFAITTALLVLGVLPAFSSEEETAATEVVQGDETDQGEDSPSLLYKKKDGDCGGCGK